MPTRAPSLIVLDMFLTWELIGERLAEAVGGQRMGMDVFLLPFAQRTIVDMEVARAIVSCDVVDPSYLCSVEYPDGGGAGEIFGMDRESLTSLMFSHFGGPIFLERMWELADRLEGLLAWTDGPADGPHFGVTKSSLVSSAHAMLQDDQQAVVVLRDAAHLNECLGGHKMTPMTYIQCG